VGGSWEFHRFTNRFPFFPLLLPTPSQSGRGEKKESKRKSRSYGTKHRRRVKLIRSEGLSLFLPSPFFFLSSLFSRASAFLVGRRWRKYKELEGWGWSFERGRGSFTSFFPPFPIARNRPAKGSVEERGGRGGAIHNPPQRFRSFPPPSPFLFFFFLSFGRKGEAKGSGGRGGFFLGAFFFPLSSPYTGIGRPEDARSAHGTRLVRASCGVSVPLFFPSLFFFFLIARAAGRAQGGPTSRSADADSRWARRSSFFFPPFFFLLLFPRLTWRPECGENKDAAIPWRGGFPLLFFFLFYSFF